MGLHMQFQRADRFTPDSITITGGYAEAVVPWKQVCIIGGPLLVSIDPVLIKALQHVFEAELLRRGKIQCSVVQLQSVAPGRKLQVRSQRPQFSIDDWLLNENAGRRPGSVEVAGIEADYSISGYKQQAAIMGLPSLRLPTNKGDHGLHSISSIVADRGQGTNFPRRTIIQFFSADAKNSLVSIEPEVSRIVFQYGGYPFIPQTINGTGILDPAILKTR